MDLCACGPTDMVTSKAACSSGRSEHDNKNWLEPSNGVHQTHRTNAHCTIACNNRSEIKPLIRNNHEPGSTTEHVGEHVEGSGTHHEEEHGEEKRRRRNP